MKKFVCCTLVLAFVYGAVAQNKPKTKTTTVATPAAKTPVMKNLIDSFSYAAGFNVGSNMMAQAIKSVNMELMQKGLQDAFKKATPALNQDQCNDVLQKQIQIFTEEKNKASKQTGIDYLAANSKKPGVITLPNGLQYEVIKAAEGTNKPRPNDTVVVNYVGTTIDGMEFDNSFKRGAPAVFPLQRVIRGWIEILQLMPVGSHWKVTIPTDLAYGEYPPQGSNIPPFAVLIFDMTLEGIKPATEEPAKTNE